jgi:hypothetical protein
MRTGVADLDLNWQVRLSPELCTKVGQRYCKPCDLLGLLVSAGLCKIIDDAFEVTVELLGDYPVIVKLDPERADVLHLKQELERVKGIPTDRIELWKVDESSAEGGPASNKADFESLCDNHLLENSSALDGPCTVTLVVKETEKHQWDPDTSGSEVAVTQNSSVATSHCYYGMSVRSKRLIEGNATHDFIFSSEESNEGMLGGDTAIGIVAAALPVHKYRENGEVCRSKHVWCITTRGNIYAGARGCTVTVPASGGDGAYRYAPEDKIGLAVDTDAGIVTFLRNGAPIPGARIKDTAIKNTPIHLFASLGLPGTSVSIIGSGTEEEEEEENDVDAEEDGEECGEEDDQEDDEDDEEEHKEKEEEETKQEEGQ